jgi:hypothetical protein
MKINAKPAIAAIAAAVITTIGAFASDVELVQISNGSGQGGPISFYRPVQRPRTASVAVYAAHHGMSSSVTTGEHQKSQYRWETIQTGSQGGQATFYRSAQ